MTTRRSLAAVPPLIERPTWSEATEVFLSRDLAQGTQRVYRLTLRAVGQQLSTTELSDVTGSMLVQALGAAYPAASPATWNRVVATVRSFLSFAARQGWATAEAAAALERRRVTEDHGRALSRYEIDRLLSRRDVDVRDRTLWRLLYETGARANEVLQLNVEDIDLDTKRACIVRKGGDRDVLHFQTGSARLLPKVISGRTRGPLFLSRRRAGGARAVPAFDRCPETGRARLSYRRAAETFRDISGGNTLHQLRHSAITHLAESGVPLPLLMAKSRHTSLRTLQRYARPSQEAVARLTAEHDPLRRR